MWNGTAAILKPMPPMTSITPSRSTGVTSWPESAVMIGRSCVVPVTPYRIDMPYSRMPSENAPNRKYLTAASFDRRFGFKYPTRM